MQGGCKASTFNTGFSCMSATPTAAGGGACAVAAVPPSLLIIDGVGLPLAGPARAMQDQGSDQNWQGRILLHAARRRD
jgi:hypothetical protein